MKVFIILLNDNYLNGVTMAMSANPYKQTKFSKLSGLSKKWTG